MSDGPDSMCWVDFSGAGVIEAVAARVAVGAEQPHAESVYVDWTHVEYWRLFDLVGEMKR